MANDAKNEITFIGDKTVFGSVGNHPQFKHIFRPTKSFTFKQLEDYSLLEASLSLWKRLTIVMPIKLIRLVNLLIACSRLIGNSKKNGARLKDIIKYIFNRRRGSLSYQLSLPIYKTLFFVPSFPYVLGQVPWIIEIEDVTTLFTPFIYNGETFLKKYEESLYYPIIKALIEDKSCKGILCHVKSTADCIPLLFKNQKLKEKVMYIPLGVNVINDENLYYKTKKENNMINILFTTSWHQHDKSFYLRGGVDLLEAFSILSQRYSNIRLILRSAIPSDLETRYRKMLISNWRIKTVQYFVSDDELHEMMLNADIFILPSARLHVVSILKAMSYGVPVVVSDGWGIEEYVEDGFNGLVIKGRNGKCSWNDRKTGALIEDYRSLWKSDPKVVKGIVDSVSKLIDNADLRHTMGVNARRTVKTKFSIEKWNESLEAVLQNAISTVLDTTVASSILKNLDEKLESILNSISKSKSKVKRDCKSVVIFGACDIGKQYLKEFRLMGINVKCFIDNFCENEKIDGIPVNQPDYLENKKHRDIDAVVLASVDRTSEMREQLKSMGVDVPIYDKPKLLFKYYC